MCRLVSDGDDHPSSYLAYSPEITIKDSSEPFRVPFYQLSSDGPVEHSAYSSDMELGIIEDNDSLREDENSLI